MDVAAFFTKWGDDVLDAQSPEGAYSGRGAAAGARARRRAGWGDAGVIVPWIAVAPLRRPPARSSATGTRWSATWPISSATTRTCCGRRGAATTTATGSRSATRRRATSIATAYLAYDAKLMAEMGRGARPRRPRRALRAAARGDRRGVQPRVRRATTASSRATRRPPTSWRCTWTCCRTGCARAPRSGSSRTSSATTATSRPASSASGCCARC